MMLFLEDSSEVSFDDRFTQTLKQNYDIKI
jgi:hypothetical protein